MDEEVDNLIEGGIEIQVDKAARLFHTLDPFPFRERDLAKDAEEFIIGWAREIPKGQRITIVVHLPKAEVQTKAGRMFGDALHNHFAHRAETATKDLRELFRIGRYSLLIGIVVLSVCVAAGRLALAALGDTEFARVLQEGLIILGWVANWRPIEIFLYEWLPLTRMRRLCRRLANAEVQLLADDAAAPSKVLGSLQASPAKEKENAATHTGEPPAPLQCRAHRHWNIRRQS